MNTLYIKQENIKAWFDAIVKAYDRVVAPVAALDVVAFSQVDAFDKVASHDSYTQTTRSAKEVLFPRTELLFSYKKEDKKVTVKDFDPQSVPSTVLWQVRPCDAASVFPLDAVFNWDYKDKLFNVRREKTTIVAVSCAKADDYCFCSSVGGGAGSTRGSDVLLTYTPNGAVVEVSTEKGEALVALAKDFFSENTED
ncbi:MAG: hypothetical protein PHD21_07690, partial [Flavobacteriales bacterium]|nr:hypothetical protein [Flavobacteriales bacterium]